MDTETVATGLAALDINTVATVVVAVATSATAYLAWRAWRQQQADREPIVELRHHWDRDGSLLLLVTIRNRLDESMVVEEASVIRPRRALLTDERARDETGGEAGFLPAEKARIRLARYVAPVGTVPSTRSFGSTQFIGSGANETIAMNVQFPHGWRGGPLKIALRIATVSLDVQRRWITIKRRIPARPTSAP
jgi:hypothetical protein